VSFRWYIYYCCLLGGCAAFVGWMFGRLPPEMPHIWQAAIRGMFLGMALAVGLTLVDVFWHFSGRDGIAVIWRVLIAGLVGGIGGFMGGMIGQILYSRTQLAVFLLVGWAITGFLIGVAPGLYDLLSRWTHNEDSTASRRKVINGLIGGTLGGIVGGLVFLVMRAFWGKIFSARVDEFWSPTASGFVALGMCIGLLIGLAQVILKTAWITVVSGFRAGRELLLSRGEMIIGRAEGCDIALFGDPGVEKQHARIALEHGQYLVEDLGTSGGTFLNGARVTRPTPLRSGDLIEIGRSSLRFGERTKRIE
jgi:hypothetical protein